ncbi:MAG: hypothetical protein ACRDKW_02200, partial [Actinomycetota bacterium]
MSHHRFLRSPLREPVLALLVIGGVMTVAPARAVPSAELSASANVTADVRGDDNPDCDEPGDDRSAAVNATSALDVAALLEDGGDANASGDGDVCLPGADANANVRTALAALLPSGEDGS